ncbi:MAG: hypothetical protein ACFHXK_21040 [bacterium]
MKITTLNTETALAFASTLPAQAQEANSPVYLLADLEVDNVETYLNDYGFPVMPLLLGNRPHYAELSHSLSR